jgi:hypothetical protein
VDAGVDRLSGARSWAVLGTSTAVTVVKRRKTSAWPSSSPVKRRRVSAPVALVVPTACTHAPSAVIGRGGVHRSSQIEGDKSGVGVQQSAVGGIEWHLRSATSTRTRMPKGAEVLAEQLVKHLSGDRVGDVTDQTPRQEIERR